MISSLHRIIYTREYVPTPQLQVDQEEATVHPLLWLSWSMSTLHLSKALRDQEVTLPVCTGHSQAVQAHITVLSVGSGCGSHHHCPAALHSKCLTSNQATMHEAYLDSACKNDACPTSPNAPRPITFSVSKSSLCRRNSVIRATTGFAVRRTSNR